MSSASSVHHKIDDANFPENVTVYYVLIQDIKQIATTCSEIVSNTSWITKLEHPKRYKTAAEETIDKLITIFQEPTDNQQKIVSQFGEYMISITAAGTLQQGENHIPLPISEMWKDRTARNSGFDFHTICPSAFINFGESKFSNTKSPYLDATRQVNSFIEKEKHLYELTNLEQLISNEPAIENLETHKSFGVILAFSINADSYQTILKNAVIGLESNLQIKEAKNIYIIGVQYIPRTRTTDASSL